MTAASVPTGHTIELDDATVIQRSWDEPGVFAELFDRHASTIHRYVSRRLSASAAGDIVGETFLIAFRGRRRYNVRQPDARPWLYGIASNLIGRHRRAEIRGYRALVRSGVDPVAESYVERVEARVTAQARNRELAKVLAELPARDRDVLLLIAWADLSYEETAEALGVPVGTVRSRMHRARRRVREALGGIDPRTITEESGHE